MKHGLDTFSSTLTIILDEIFSELDPASRCRIKNRILQRAGLIRDASKHLTDTERQRGEAVASSLENFAEHHIEPS